jgi:phage terminase large subunit-like protein
MPSPKHSDKVMVKKDASQNKKSMRIRQRHIPPGKELVVAAPTVITWPDEYEKAELMKAFIEETCFVPEGMLIGQPFHLLPFELEFIKNVYRTRNGRRIVRRAIMSVGRKNGKTGLIASLLLGHLVGPAAVVNSQIYSTAQSRRQAAIVFKLLVKITNQNAILTSNVYIKDNQSQVIGLGPNTSYESLSSNSSAAMGFSPILAIHDELGQAGAICPIYDAVETGMGAHDEALSLIISTQAPNDVALLSTLIDDALESPDERTYLCLHTAPEECDIHDMDGWVAANPAMGIYRSEADILEQADRARRIPSLEPTFRNLILNQRVDTQKVFLPRNLWALGNEPPDYEACKGLKAYLGLDLSSRIDLTALVADVPLPNGKHAIFPRCFLPEAGIQDRELKDKVPYSAWAKEGHLILTPGSVVDYDFVLDHIKEFMKHFDVEKVAFDRWRIEFLKMIAEKDGLKLPLVPFGQGFKDMSPAMESIETLVTAGQILHGGHPVLKWAMSNAKVRKDPSGNRKLDKDKSATRIDPAVALVMACGCIFKEVGDPPPGTPFIMTVGGGPEIVTEP